MKSKTEVRRRKRAKQSLTVRDSLTDLENLLVEIRTIAGANWSAMGDAYSQINGKATDAQMILLDLPSSIFSLPSSRNSMRRALIREKRANFHSTGSAGVPRSLHPLSSTPAPEVLYPTGNMQQ